MQKVIFILKDVHDESYHAFGTRIMDFAQSLVKKYNPLSLKIVLTSRKPPLLSVIPFRKEKIAVLSITASGEELRQVIADSENFTGGYLVEEAVPVAYEKNWNDGDPTPGVCLLTLFHKKPGMKKDEFLRRWHEGHTPLSLELHPLWSYNRNEVRKLLTKASPWYDGIVEEQFRTASLLLNPLQFFGPPLKVPRHMLKVYRDTRSFIDMKRIETYLATEIHIRS